MIKSITYFNPHKTALTASLVFALGSLIFIVPMAIGFSFMPSVDNDGNPVNTQFPTMMMFMPVFYLIFGYIWTAFSAWIYNIVAKYTGGIKLDLDEQ